MELDMLEGIMRRSRAKYTYEYWLNELNSLDRTPKRTTDINDIQ